jgi:hypothetical protein
MEPNSDATSSAPAAAVPAERKEKMRRRTQSEPGEQSAPITFSPRQLRVRAPKQPRLDRKQRKEAKEAAIMALLDETHRRRMEALGEAVEAAATSQQ